MFLLASDLYALSTDAVCSYEVGSEQASLEGEEANPLQALTFLTDEITRVRVSYLWGEM